MLLKPFCGCFTGHAHIQAFQYTIELRVGGAEPGVLGEDAFREFYDVDMVFQAGILLQQCIRNMNPASDPTPGIAGSSHPYHIVYN